MHHLEASNRNPNATKRGPGRYHKQGHKKASPPTACGRAAQANLAQL